jgi:hypothetical protein
VVFVVMPALLESASLDRGPPNRGGIEEDSDGGDDGGIRRPAAKGDYSLVASLDAGDEEDPSNLFSARSPDDDEIGEHDDRGQPERRDGIMRDSQDGSLFPAARRLLHVTLLPDDRFALAGVKLLDGPSAVKLLKFCALTFAMVAAMHAAIRRAGWESDPRMRLPDLWLYEGNLVVLDSVLFFVVGRMHRQRGVDHLAWMAWMLAANLYASGITNLAFLRHSVTLYEMRCKWPWKLWAFVGLILPLVVAIILLHVRRAVRDGVFVVKLIEMILSVVLFLIPPLTSDYFHLHHWFAGWIIGMHCNFDVWWSRATMAWCWGLYVNGIAAYGRDPLLTCGYAYWLSTDLRCPYMQCYLDALEQAAMQNDTAANHTVKPMITPDWRNCSADGYHP